MRTSTFNPASFIFETTLFMDTTINPLGQRFRGYLPVIVDIETAGFNAKKILSWKLPLLLWNLMQKVN